MTGSELYTYILAVLKRDDKSTEVYQAITDVVFDMRLRFHSQDFKVVSSALTIGTVGNYSATLPSDFGHLIGDVIVHETVSDRAYPKLMKLSIDQYNDLYDNRYNTSADNRLTGSPVHYCIFNDAILVGPPVDKTTYEFRIAYTQEDEVDITSSTASVPFTPRYRKCVRYGVLKEVYLMLENYEEAAGWSTLYEQDLVKIIENDKSNSKDNTTLSYNGI